MLGSVFRSGGVAVPVAVRAVGDDADDLLLKLVGETDAEDAREFGFAEFDFNPGRGCSIEETIEATAA